MRRIVVPLAAAALLAVVATGVVLALNYEGEDFCQDSPAWPNGTYLGQMHPYHSDFYRGYAERRGWDPCTTWATDQRNSAIRGLRELGYAVVPPGEAVQTASPAVNRQQKSGKDAAEWMPDLNQCWFASRVLQVRVAYGLTLAG